MQLGVNGRQEPLPVLRRANMEGVKKFQADCSNVSSTEFGLWRQITNDYKLVKSIIHNKECGEGIKLKEFQSTVPTV